MLANGGGHLVGGKVRSEEDPVLLLTVPERKGYKIVHDNSTAMMSDSSFLVAPIQIDLALLQLSSEIVCKGAPYWYRRKPGPRLAVLVGCPETMFAILHNRQHRLWCGICQSSFSGHGHV